ncbi:MAG: metallophosphoesterase [Spirochaetota bacterium]
MNFYWNHFSVTNLFLDLLTVIVFMLLFSYFLRRKGERLASCRFSLVYSKAFLQTALFIFACSIIVSLFPGLSTFLRIRVLWTILVVIVPILLCWQSYRFRRIWPLLFVCILLTLKYYAEVWEPNNLEILPIQIRHEKVSSPIKLVHLSDLQTDGINELHQKVKVSIERFQPDLILFTGDVLNHKELIPSVYAYLHSIATQDRSFFVEGNVDGILDMQDFVKKLVSKSCKRKLNLCK